MPDLASVFAIVLATTIILWRLASYSQPPCTKDLELLVRSYDARKPWLNRLLQSISLLGSIFFLSPISLPILWYLMRSGKFGHACLLALSLNGVCIIANIIKRCVKRPRPTLFPAIGKKPEDASFPSAHSAQILTFIVSALTLFSETSPSWISFILIGIGCGVVLSVAYSRIYLQHHYPSDVFGGLILGIGWFLAALSLLKFSGISLK